MKRALVMALAVSCSAAVPEDRTTVRVRVSVTDTPDTVLVATQPEPPPVVATPRLPRVYTPVARPERPAPPPTPTCGFARDPSLRMVSYAEVSLGHGHTCVRIEDGSVRCWGANLDGETGNGSTGTDRGPAAPAQVRDVEGATQVCVGFSYSCARLRDGTAECWGNNTHNQIRFSLRASCTASPVRSPVDHIRSLSCGGWHVCALRNDGSVWCWGEDAPRYSPWRVPLRGRVAEVASGHHRSCARMESGAVYCWTVSSRTPAEVTGFAAAPTQLAVAERFACATLADHRAACWGDGYHGELGNGAPLESREPVVVSAVPDVVEVSANEGRACAVTAAGEVWCWGAGDARRSASREGVAAIDPPMKLGSVGPTDHIYVGDQHACARTRVGDLCCWGRNYYGQLGNNQTTSPDSDVAPVAVLW